MTPDATIAEQARREASEAWMNAGLLPKYVSPEDWKIGYAAALIAERSKPQPSVDEVMEEVSLWYADPERSKPGLTMYENWKMLYDRLTKRFNK